MGFYLKDPHARVDYAIDWGGYLDGQTIAESQWSVTPDEAGGIVGRTYSLANRVTMSDGSVDERSIVLRVEDR